MPVCLYELSKWNTNREVISEVNLEKHLRNFKSTSGKSSKYDVSSIPFTSTAIEAGLSLKQENTKPCFSSWHVATVQIIFNINPFSTNGHAASPDSCSKYLQLASEWHTSL